MWRKIKQLIQKFKRMQKDKLKDKPKNKSKYHWILDAGHGGVHPETGEYQTRGKRSPTFPETSEHAGQVLYEGVRNRRIVEMFSRVIV